MTVSRENASPCDSAIFQYTGFAVDISENQIKQLVVNALERRMQMVRHCYGKAHGGIGTFRPGSKLRRLISAVAVLLIASLIVCVPTDFAMAG